MDRQATSTIRLLHLSDLHIATEPAPFVRKRYCESLKALVSTWRDRDVQTVASLRPSEVISCFASLCLFATRNTRMVVTKQSNAAHRIGTWRERLRLGLKCFVESSLAADTETPSTFVESFLSVMSDKRIGLLAESRFDALLEDLSNDSERIRVQIQRLAESRCPVDVVVITGDILDKGYLACTPEDYEQRLQLAFEVLDAIVKSVGIVDRSRILLLSGNHDWFYEKATENVADGFITAVYNASLRRFINCGLNPFFAQFTPPVSPDSQHFFRILRLDNMPVGAVPHPARLAIVAFQGESLPKDHKVKVAIGAGIAVTANGPDAVAAKMAGTGVAMLPESDLECLGRLLRENLATTGEGPVVIVSASHERLLAKEPHDPPLHGHHRTDQSIRLAKFLENWGVGLHLAGHEHDGADPSGRAIPEFVSEHGDMSFAVFEFTNAYPDAPRLSVANRYRFTDEWSRRETGYKLGNAWQLEQDSEPLTYGGCKLLKYRWTGDSPGGALSLFHSTACRKRSEQTQSVVSYVGALEDHSCSHMCPYPDVYTRYFRWVFDTSECVHGKASDDIVVFHVGPFYKWLLEPMNAEYFLRQLVRAKENRVNIWRVFLVPRGRYSSLTDWGFEETAEMRPWKESFGKRAQTHRLSPAPGLTPTEVSIRPCEKVKGKIVPFASFKSFVVTETLLEFLSGGANYQSIDSTYGLAAEEKEKWRRVMKVNAIAIRGFHDAAGHIRAALKSEQDEWKLWVGQAYRQTHESREALTFAYQGSDLQRARVRFSTASAKYPDSDVVEGLRQLAVLLFHVDSSPIVTELAELVQLRKPSDLQGIVLRETQAANNRKRGH